MPFFQRKPENSHTVSCNIPRTEHCAMALSLDMARQTERVIIGEMKEIARYFEGCVNPEPVILVDEVRPMGTMISELFETRPLDAIDAATGFRPDMVHHRPDLLEKAMRVTEELYASSNLVWRFAALRLWQEYQAVKGLPETREINDGLDQIIYPVRTSHEQQIKSWHMVYTYSDLYRFLGGEYFDFPAWVMYQAGRPMTVYHVTDFSILPLYVHYLNTVYTKQAFFQYCKRCGRLYVAHTTKVKGFCSEECRKAQQRENRKKYDDSVKGDAAESNYRAAYMYWYNRMKILRRNPDVDAGRMAELETAFKAFRDEATERKRDVQRKKADVGAFMAWLDEQRGRFDELAEGLPL